MLDLDKYINNSIQIKLFGAEYDVLEPTIKMTMEVDRIESDLTKENLHKKRLETGVLLLSHNKQGRIFTEEELSELPFEALTRVLAEITVLRLKADADPNSASQSQAAK